MKVREMMKSNPQHVSPQDSIQDATRIMRDDDVGIVPVLEGARIAGVITDRDIAVRASAAGAAPDAPVRRYMTTDVVCVSADTSHREAADLMARHAIRRLPVVDENDRLVGIVSLSDIALKAGAVARYAAAR